MKHRIIFATLGLMGLPVVAFAAPFNGVRSMITEIIGIVGQLRGLVVGLALLYFFWGLAKYIRASGDEKELAAGKRIMIWGVVALFVMTSVGGIIILLQQQVGVSGGGVLQVVQPNGQGGGGGGNTSNSQSGNGNSPFGNDDSNSEGVSPFSGNGCDPEASEGQCDTDTNPPASGGDNGGAWAPCGPDSYDEEPC